MAKAPPPGWITLELYRAQKKEAMSRQRYNVLIREGRIPSYWDGSRWWVPQQFKVAPPKKDSKGY